MAIIQVTDPDTQGKVSVNLALKSLIDPVDWLTEQSIQKRISQTENLTLIQANKQSPGRQWTLRSLRSTDMPDDSNNHWVSQTGGTANNWATSSFASGTAETPEDTYIGLYGINITGQSGVAGVFPWGALSAAPPVTGVRLSVGGTRVMQWDLMPLIKAVGTTTSTSTADTGVLGPLVERQQGFFRSPIVINQKKTVTIDFYETGATASLYYIIELIGVVAETSGSGAGLNAGS